MGQKDIAMTCEQLDQVKQGAAAIARGEPVPPVAAVITRSRLVNSPVLSPAEAELAFKERVIEIDTGR